METSTQRNKFYPNSLVFATQPVKNKTIRLGCLSNLILNIKGEPKQKTA